MAQGIGSLDDLIKAIQTYKNQVILVLAVIAALTGSIFGYMYFKKNREEKAYRTMVVAMEYFEAPIKADDDKDEDPNDLSFLNKKEFKTKKEKWEKVQQVFAEAYKNHCSSGLAPVFLAYQAEAQINLNNLAEAIKLIREAISQAHPREVKEQYQVKLALMLIDTKNDASITEGLSMLKKIAADDHSVSHDTALYYLGDYYWHRKKFVDARNYWNQLLLKYGKDEKNPSPWVPVAKERLRLIDSDVE